MLQRNVHDDSGVHHESSRGRQSWWTSRGRVTLTRPAPHVAVQRVEGYFDSQFVTPMMRHWHALMAEGYAPAIFNDWELAENYATDVRLRLTHWTMRQRPNLGPVHNLVRSRFLQMGVTVANLALGGSMEVHRERHPFEEALRGECRKDSAAALSVRPEPSAFVVG